MLIMSCVLVILCLDDIYDINEIFNGKIEDLVLKIIGADTVMH